MPTIEVLQPEAGDDRNKEAEIAKLNEMYYGPDSKLFESERPGYGVGELIVEAAPQAYHGFELRRNARRVGGPILRLSKGFHNPVQSPQTLSRAHVRRFSPFN